jgi:hypothetical protein
MFRYNTLALAMLALLSATASAHSVETVNGGRDGIQITINVGQTKELHLTPDTKIYQTSDLVFEIVVRNQQEACELAQTINPYNSESTPCSHEPAVNTREQTENTSEHMENTNEHYEEKNAAETSETFERAGRSTDGSVVQGPQAYAPSTAPNVLPGVLGQDPSNKLAPSFVGSKPSALDRHQLKLAETTLVDNQDAPKDPSLNRECIYPVLAPSHCAVGSVGSV